MLLNNGKKHMILLFIICNAILIITITNRTMSSTKMHICTLVRSFDTMILCESTVNATILAGTSAQMARARLELRAAATIARVFFRGTNPPGLVILTDLPVEIKKNIDIQQFAWTLNYKLGKHFGELGGLRNFGHEEGVALSREEVSNLAQGLLRAGILSGEAGDLALIVDVLSGAPQSDMASTFLRHEICHRYAEVAFTRAGGRLRDLPEFLSESAAVACETEALRAHRRARFLEIVAKRDIIPLSNFFTMDHPLKSSQWFRNLLDDANNKGIDTFSFSFTIDSNEGEAVSLYYTQNSVFVEYIVSRSDRNDILGTIILELPNYNSFDVWLRERGRIFGLSDNIAALEADFKNWLQRTFPTMASEKRL